MSLFLNTLHNTHRSFWPLIKKAYPEIISIFILMQILTYIYQVHPFFSPIADILSMAQTKQYEGLSPNEIMKIELFTSCFYMILYFTEYFLFLMLIPLRLNETDNNSELKKESYLNFSARQMIPLTIAGIVGFNKFTLMEFIISYSWHHKIFKIHICSLHSDV